MFKKYLIMVLFSSLVACMKEQTEVEQPLEEYITFTVSVNSKLTKVIDGIDEENEKRIDNY